MSGAERPETPSDLSDITDDVSLLHLKVDGKRKLTITTL